MADSAITALLADGDADHHELMDRLVPLVYDELRQMAHRELELETGPRTLNTTGLVHEAYLKLTAGRTTPLRNRRYFFGAAVRSMRQILVDAARRRNRLKRGGGEPVLPLDGSKIEIDTYAEELLLLDDALTRLAERADGAYEQRVAVKLLPTALRSDALARRFLLERQILAHLEHPGIARLLDGGVTDHGEEPYIVLEYVEGEPLTRWCDARRLSVAERLRLFLRICEAVQYAHGRLVVHRDLKPSNVLVTGEGEVKLLDFGIAKLLTEDGEAEVTALTRLGLRPYTPGYAAPEQLRGEPVTVATDVYALGVLLYELLTGRRPHESDAGAAQRAQGPWRTPPRPSSAFGQIDKSGPDDTHSSGGRPKEAALRLGTSPERLRRRLSGDLDTIALKALHEEPKRRYESVQALAEDVRRHLAEQPIAARTASTRYRVGRFLRRNRLATAATALVVLAVLGGLAGTAWQARVAQRERDAARAEKAKAEQVADFLADIFRRANPVESQGEEITVREALDRGAERIGEALADQPVVRAELLVVLGGTYLELGDLERAETLTTEALELRRRHLGRDHPDVAEALRVLGVLRYRQGDYPRAVEVSRRGVEILETSLGPAALELAGLLNNLGIFYRLTGDYSQGIQAYERALALRERHLGPDALEVGKVSLNLGTLLSAMGRDDRALAAYERALAIYEGELGPDHPMVAAALSNISQIRMRREQFEGMEEILRRALAIHRKAYGPVHHYVGTSLNMLGQFLAATGRSEEAIEAYLRAADVDRRALGEDHPNVSYPLHNLGELYRSEGRPAEAVSYFRQAVALREAGLGADHPLPATSLEGLGRAQAALGEIEDAETHLRRALAIRRLSKEPDREELASSAVSLADLLVGRSRCAEALPLLDEAAGMLEGNEAGEASRARIDELLAACSGAG